jgi:hypothetical protein
MYERVIQQLQAQEIEVPAEIYNNIGVLHFRLKNWEKAKVQIRL